MRMKFNKPIQLLAISAASLLAASFLSACATLTVDFVYVTSAKAAGPNNYGEVDVFEINSESGRMRQIVTSPFPSGGRNPVAEAVSPDEADLYVVNRDDNTIVQFVIGNDGKLYPQNTVNTPGIFPLAVSVSGSYLYVIDTYQPLPTCNPASPCSGSVAVFPILTASQAATLTPLNRPTLLELPCKHQHQRQLLASPAVRRQPHRMYSCPPRSQPLPRAPMSMSPATIPRRTSAMSSDLQPDSGAPSQRLSGFPVPVGTRPSAVASDASGAYLYVTDSAQNVVYGFQISGGALTASQRQPISYRQLNRLPSYWTPRANMPWSQTGRTPMWASTQSVPAA